MEKKIVITINDEGINIKSDDSLRLHEIIGLLQMALTNAITQINNKPPLEVI